MLELFLVILGQLLVELLKLGRIVNIERQEVLRWQDVKVHLGIYEQLLDRWCHTKIHFEVRMIDQVFRPWSLQEVAPHCVIDKLQGFQGDLLDFKPGINVNLPFFFAYFLSFRWFILVAWEH